MYEIFDIAQVIDAHLGSLGEKNSLFNRFEVGEKIFVSRAVDSSYTQDDNRKILFESKGFFFPEKFALAVSRDGMRFVIFFNWISVERRASSCSAAEIKYLFGFDVLSTKRVKKTCSCVFLKSFYRTIS